LFSTLKKEKKGREKNDVGKYHFLCKQQRCQREEVEKKMAFLGVVSSQRMRV
jgi:hypothetical protein